MVLNLRLWALVLLDSLCLGERGARNSFGPDFVVDLLQVDEGHRVAILVAAVEGISLIQVRFVLLLLYFVCMIRIFRDVLRVLVELDIDFCVLVHLYGDS